MIGKWELDYDYRKKNTWKGGFNTSFLKEPNSKETKLESGFAFRVKGANQNFWQIQK